MGTFENSLNTPGRETSQEAMKVIAKQRGIFEKVPGSGEWWICYHDQTGRRRREKAGTKSVAIQLYRKRKQQILEGVKLPEKLRRRVVPFTEIAKDTLEYSKATKVEEAYRIDGWKMETFLAWFRGRSAEEITPQDIERKLSTLADPGLKAATLNRYRTLLSLIYSLAIRNGKLSSNPVRKVKRRKENNERVRFLDEREEVALREKIRELHAEREAEFDLALHTGMRRGEQYQLRWENIDFSNGIITIPRSKHGEARYIQINSTARAALLQLKERSGQAVHVCPGLDHSRKRYSRKWFEEVTEEAKISNFHWHDLRHTFASRLVMAGVPLRAVQVLMGLKRPCVTPISGKITCAMLWNDWSAVKPQRGLSKRQTNCHQNCHQRELPQDLVIVAFGVS